MSQTVYENLVTVYNELQGAKTNINASRAAIIEAIRYNGITSVEDDDTFEKCAELIKRLKSANSMVLEFTIPSTATTNYKRTIVLPLYFGTNYAPSSMDSIAQEIIAADNGVYSSSRSAILGASNDTSDNSDNHIITDFYGNECTDGNYVITMDDIETYLSEEQQEELLSHIEENPENFAAARSGAILGADSDTSDANYEYTVDWGDGSEECTYTSDGDYSTNKAAMWHTYDKAGTYDVSINGNFRRVFSQSYTTALSSLVVDSEYVYDTDGVVVYSGENYAMRNHLVEVIAWGNTLLTNMQYAFCNCRNLASIPMYDTTNSFADVTNMSYTFYYCTSLTSLPYNSSTDKGLFSGCDKVTTFASCFSYCTGITGSIPVKLIDGCTAVTSVAAMFAYSKCSGDIPTGLLSGMSSLTNASEMFASCSLSGNLSDDLFVDCPNVTNIYRLFYGVTGVTGTLSRNFIGGLSKLTDMRQAFRGCTGITGIDYDAFYNLTANSINCREAFKGCTKITEIPEGLLESMTGTGLMLERMFDGCTGITSLASSSLENLKVANARGMFGGCTALASACPTSNSDWETYDTIKKWYGVFADTNLSDIDSVCVELGGNGGRKFSQGSVGKIVLQDKTLVEVADYSYDSSNTPIGVIYADVYLDESSSIATLSSGSGNVVEDETSGSRHVLFATTFTDTSKTWTSSQNLAEDVSTITNTSNVEVVYNKFSYTSSTDSDGNVTYTQERAVTRYNGEAYSKALLKFVFEKGYATNVTTDTYTSYSVVTSLPTSASDMVTTNIYYMVDSSDDNHYIAYVVNVSTMKEDSSLDVYLNKLESDRYPAITYCNTYSTNGITAGTCFLPDGADLWDQFTQRHLINKATAKIISGKNGFTSSNCYPMRDGSDYWASAGYISSDAWRCGTYSAGLGASSLKWVSYYVRPAFAIEE